MEDMLKQAKAKALRLLEDMDRTEEQLRLKLRQRGFEEDVAQKALEYVKSFGYVNDESYAERFILNKQGTKSRREIYFMLCQKGVSRENIERAMEKCYNHDSEEDAIRRLCAKKHYVEENCTEGEKKKLYDYLVRKGFHHDDVRRVLNI